MAKSKYDDIGSDTIDHTSDERFPPDPAPMPPDDAARLRELRELQAASDLGDAGKEELARLSLAESEAAGHVVAEPGKEKHPGEVHMMDMLGLVEAIIDSLPALRSLRPQLDAIKNRLELLLNPPDKG